MELADTMSVRAGSSASLVTLICAAVFLTWACHLGRPQVDELDLPVCRSPDINDTTDEFESDFDCNRVEEFFSKFCKDGNIMLETEPVAVIKSKSSVLTYVNASNDNVTLYYKLCRFFAKGGMDLIECTHNGTELDVEVKWNKLGLTRLSVFVFTANLYNMTDFMGCAKTNITVAENRGLKLFVSLHNDPAEPSIIPAHLCPNNFDPSSDIDNIFESNKEKYYLVGNITFSCMTNRSNDTLYFKYRFGDGETEPYTLSSDFTTHTYGKAGVYNYTVDAVAVTESSKAFHAAHSGQIRVLEPVSGISMAANQQNTFTVNELSTVNISAFGTLPIMACWYVRTAERPLYNKIDCDSTTTSSQSPICICKPMTSQTFILESMVFDEVGSYTFIAEFHNNASKANKTIPFQVIGGPQRIVVASTSTLIAILAFLIAFVSVLMIIMGLYIPYRKYKTRFTETANFNFVDLTESTHWDRAKMKVREVTEKFNRNRKSSKVGLVNEQYEPTRLAQFVTYEAVS